MLTLAETVQNKFLGLIGYIRYQVLERHFIHTMRIGLVVTTLVLALFAGFTTREPIIAIAAVGLMGAILVMTIVYNHMETAVLMLMLTTTILNPPIPRDITLTLLLLLLLTVMWIIKLVIVQKSFSSIVAASPNRIVPIFIVIVVISFLWSNTYVDPLVYHFQNEKMLPRIVTMLVITLSPVAMLLFGNFLRTLRAIKWVIWYYLIFGGILMVPRLLKIGIPSIFNFNGQFPAWICIFALGQLIYNPKLKRWHRTALFILFGGWAYIQIGLGIEWLSGWIPVAIGVFIITFLRSKFVALLLVIVLVLGVLSDSETLEKTLEEENTVSGQTRTQAASVAFDIANQHYLFGTGPTGYFFYVTVYVGGLFQLSHNNYIDIYAQTGFLGFFTYIILWGSIGLTVWRVYRKIPRNSFAGGLAASLVAAYFISLAAMMLGDWVIPFTYTQTMRGLSYTIWHWLWMGLAIALNHLFDKVPPKSYRWK